MKNMSLKELAVRAFGSFAAREKDMNEMAELYNSMPQEIKSGLDMCFANRLPELSSDIIGKSVFNPDIYPERVRYLISEIAQDATIEVTGSASNEGVVQSVYSKKMLFDIAAKLGDSRSAVIELQKVKQKFFSKRSDLYKSNMLLLQYSVNKGQNKSEIVYDDLQGIILIFLFCKSPDLLAEYDSEHYIHRINCQIADTGLKVPCLDTVIYVQLDKCLEQFKNNIDGENNRELQKMLCMIADINDPEVKESIKDNEFLLEIYEDVEELSKQKEVQMTILSDQMEEYLYNMEMNEIRRLARYEGFSEGRSEGFSEGRSEGFSEGRSEGFSEGRSEGFSEGRSEGLNEGEINMLVKTVVAMIRKNMTVGEIAELTDASEEQINNIASVVNDFSSECDRDKIVEEYIKRFTP